MTIAQVTVVYLVTRPLHGSEAEVDLVLMQTFLHFLCKSRAHANKFLLNMIYM